MDSSPPSNGISTRKPRHFYGWYLVAAGSCIQLLVGALMEQSFGGYAAALTREYGWSRGALSGVFSVSRLLAGVLGPPQGWLLDRYGPRAVMRFGLVMFALGFMAFSQLHSLAMFYVTFAVMSVGASLGGFISVAVAVVNWFDRYRARALGIAFIGYAAGGLVAPAVILAVTRDWRVAAFGSGVIILVVGLPLTLFMHRRPEEIGLHVDGLTPAEAASRRDRDVTERRRASTSTTTDFTAREALHTRAFWMIASGHGSSLVVVSAVQVHLFLHLTASLHYADGAAAAVLGLMTALQIAGQLVGGYLGDRVSKRLVVVVCMATHAVALLLLAQVGGVSAVLGFAVLHGFAWGVRGPLMAALNADYFGRTSFGSIFGMSTMIVTIGLIAGPLIAGVLYDRTGSYATGFTVTAIVAALGSIFFVLATRPALPPRIVVNTAAAADA
ncbi:MAG: MFS transporter [Chloroflexota bacterium]